MAVVCARFLAVVVVLCCLLLLSSLTPAISAISFPFGTKAETDGEFPIEALDSLLDKVENAGSVLLKYTHKYRKAIKGVAGALIFVYGANFPATLLMYQAIGATGLPGVQKNMNELLSTYQSTRRTFKDEMPQILKARKALDEALASKNDLEQRLREAESAYRGKEMSKEQYKATSEDIKSQLEVVKKQMKQLSQVSSSFKRIYSALDPDHLKGVLSSLYVSVLSVVAAASNQLLAKATIGLQIGRALAERVSHIITQQRSAWQQQHGDSLTARHDSSLSTILSHFMQSNAAWMQNAITAGSTLLGVVLMHVFKKAMFIASACTTGAQMMLDSCAAVVDPVLQEMGLPTLASDCNTAAVLQSSLVAVGVYMNLSGAAQVPLLLKIVFAPLYAVEVAFRTLFPTSFIGKP